MSDAYRRARKLGERDTREALAASRFPYLHALDSMLRPDETAGEECVGTMEIPLSMVVGTKTEGRQNSFSRTFMPLLESDTEFALKWSALYDVQVEEGFHDPVKVYEFMHRFYVQEGNKRVSVLKYLGALTVSADVTRIVPSKWEGLENRLYGEFLEFWRAVPLYDIEFTREGSYRKLAAYMGRDLSGPWPEEDVHRLRSLYLFFAAIYESKGGRHLDITPADALLVYLGVYAQDDILETPSAVIGRRIEKIWRELVLEESGGALAVAEEPAEAPRKRGKLLDTVVKLLPYSSRKPLHASFIYKGAVGESRWAAAHDAGRRSLERLFDGMVVTNCYEGCKTDEMVGAAIDVAVAAGADVVFTTSPVHMAATVKAALKYPDVRFLNCSVNLPRDSVRSYYGRMYEAKFLLGALAASVADNHVIGYRADLPIYGTFSNINAFAIGAALVDPQARIVLKWSSKEGGDWLAEMVDEGVSVLSGADSAKPWSDSNKYGVYRLSGSGVQNLGQPVWNWGRYYELIVQSLIQGTWDDVVAPGGCVRAVNYWYGMKSGVIDVQLADGVSYYSRKLVSMLRTGIVTETLSPFDGELHSQDGMVKAADSGRLSSLDVVTMDWLNDNVEGGLPREWELSAPARDEVKVNGVSAR